MNKHKHEHKKSNGHKLIKKAIERVKKQEKKETAPIEKFIKPEKVTSIALWDFNYTFLNDAQRAEVKSLIEKGLTENDINHLKIRYPGMITRVG